MRTILYISSLLATVPERVTTPLFVETETNLELPMSDESLMIADLTFVVICASVAVWDILLFMLLEELQE